MRLPDYISYYVYLGRDRKLVKKLVGGGPPEANIRHLRNFLRAMRSRKSSDLNAEAELGSQWAAMCHFANIAYREPYAVPVEV